MDSQQHQKATKHFEKYWRYKPCPCCGSLDWGVKDKLAFMPHVIDRDLDLNTGYTYITATCGKCSYSIFFNAADAGIN